MPGGFGSLQRHRLQICVHRIAHQVQRLVGDPPVDLGEEVVAEFPKQLVAFGPDLDGDVLRASDVGVPQLLVDDKQVCRRLLEIQLNPCVGRLHPRRNGVPEVTILAGPGRRKSLLVRHPLLDDVLLHPRRQGLLHGCPSVVEVFHGGLLDQVLLVIGEGLPILALERAFELGDILDNMPVAEEVDCGRKVLLDRVHQGHLVVRHDDLDVEIMEDFVGCRQSPIVVRLFLRLHKAEECGESLVRRRNPDAVEERKTMLVRLVRRVHDEDGRRHLGEPNCVREGEEEVSHLPLVVVLHSVRHLVRLQGVEKSLNWSPVLEHLARELRTVGRQILGLDAKTGVILPQIGRHDPGLVQEDLVFHGVEHQAQVASTWPFRRSSGRPCGIAKILSLCGDEGARGLKAKVARHSVRPSGLRRCLFVLYVEP